MGRRSCSGSEKLGLAPKGLQNLLGCVRALLHQAFYYAKGSSLVFSSPLILHKSYLDCMIVCVGLLCSSSFGSGQKWGRTQMGSDGFNRILTGFYLLDPAKVRPVPSETHGFKGFRLDFNRIPWNLVKIWLKIA